jgi:hypothetical protein
MEIHQIKKIKLTINLQLNCNKIILNMIRDIKHNFNKIQKKLVDVKELRFLKIVIKQTLGEKRKKTTMKKTNKKVKVNKNIKWMLSDNKWKILVLKINYKIFY